MNLNPKGVIYIRDNVWWKMENIYKLGISSICKDRESPYITGEVERGEYKLVIEIPLAQMKIIDNLLKQKFKEHHIYKGGGTEFYNRCIIDLIEPYLQELNIKYTVLTKEEINLMDRCERVRNIPNINNVKKIFNQLNLKKIIQKLKNKRRNITHNESIECAVIDKLFHEIIRPNAQQQYILEMIEGFYRFNDIGKLIWACGLGKALLSILIVNVFNFKSVIIGVPSKYLQKQIKKEILKLFPNKDNILFIGGDEDDGVKTTTNKEIIKLFLNQDNNETRFIISTYHSCYLLVDDEIRFDFKIGDEAHHLVGSDKEEEKGFRLFHKILSTKTLFMTATEKVIESQMTKAKYSMEDETIFGQYIDIKTVHWAIENKKITDYNIVVLKNSEDDVDNIISSLGINVCNKELFISCYICLKSFETYDDLSHILLYTNTTKDAELAKIYINQIIDLDLKNLSIKKEDIYNNALHSNSKNCGDLEGEVNEFVNKKYGIISCVYIFGEGFDLPKLNGVCIAGNMQSEIRIVQYLLRPNRLEKENPNKKSYIIIPYIDTNDWEMENKSYEKVRTIVSQMRNVDESVEQKIFISIGIKKKKIEKNEEEIYYEDYDFEENSGELSKIKLRLRRSKALGSKFTEEQDEYNYIRSINTLLNIKSKQEYEQSNRNRIHSNFIVSPEEYFKTKGVWTDWYDFMGFNTTKFIQSKQEWINFCKEKNIISLDNYYALCELYDILPKEPAIFYKDFTNIPSELSFNKTRRRQ
jgi:superfamily II DNA or RNA helicase